MAGWCLHPNTWKGAVRSPPMLAQQANPELFACASVAWPKATARSHRRQVFVVPEALVVIGGWEPRIAVDHDSCQLFAALDSWPWIGSDHHGSRLLARVHWKPRMGPWIALDVHWEGPRIALNLGWELLHSGSVHWGPRVALDHRECC